MDRWRRSSSAGNVQRSATTGHRFTRMRDSLLGRSSSPGPPTPTAQTPHLEQPISPQETRDVDSHPTRPASGISETGWKRATEPFGNLRNSLFGGRKPSNASTTSRPARPESRSSIRNDSEHAPRRSRDYSRSAADREFRAQSHSLLESRDARSDSQRSISPPFNFKHVTHTSRDHLSALEKVDETHLRAEFWSVSGYQRPRRQPYGSPADDLPEKRYATYSLRDSPVSRPISPSSIQSSQERSRIATPVGVPYSIDETIFDGTNDTSFTPEDVLIAPAEDSAQLPPKPESSDLRPPERPWLQRNPSSFDSASSGDSDALSDQVYRSASETPDRGTLLDTVLEEQEPMTLDFVSPPPTLPLPPLPTPPITDAAETAPILQVLPAEPSKPKEGLVESTPLASLPKELATSKGLGDAIEPTSTSLKPLSNPAESIQLSTPATASESETVQKDSHSSTSLNPPIASLQDEIPVAAENDSQDKPLFTTSPSTSTVSLERSAPTTEIMAVKRSLKKSLPTSGPSSSVASLRSMFEQSNPPKTPPNDSVVREVRRKVSQASTPPIEPVAMNNTPIESQENVDLPNEADAKTPTPMKPCEPIARPMEPVVEKETNQAVIPPVVAPHETPKVPDEPVALLQEPTTRITEEPVTLSKEAINLLKEPVALQKDPVALPKEPNTLQQPVALPDKSATPPKAPVTVEVNPPANPRPIVLMKELPKVPTQQITPPNEPIVMDATPTKDVQPTPRQKELPKVPIEPITLTNGAQAMRDTPLILSRLVTSPNQPVAVRDTPVMTRRPITPPNAPSVEKQPAHKVSPITPPNATAASSRSTPRSHAPSTFSSVFSDEAWEDYVDFSYEQEADSSCDFDWQNLSPNRDSVSSDGGVRSPSTGQLLQSPFAPTSNPSDLRRKLHTNNFAKRASGERQKGHTRGSSVGHHGFLAARGKSSDMLRSSAEEATTPQGKSPLNEPVVSEPTSDLYHDFVKKNSCVEPRKTAAYRASGQFPATTGVLTDYLSDPESIRNSMSDHSKSSAPASHDRFALRSLFSRDKTKRSSTASTSSITDLFTSSRTSKTSAPKTVISQPVIAAGQHPSLKQGHLRGLENGMTGLPSVSKPWMENGSPAISRPQTPGDRAATPTNGQRAPKRPLTPKRFSRMMQSESWI